MTSYSDLLGPPRAKAPVKHASTRTSQSQPIKGREADMIVNAAGGYVFAVDDWTRLRRFLILGTTQGTYYANAEKLGAESLELLKRAFNADPIKFVDTVVEVSVSGAPLKQSPCIFAIAFACSQTTGDPAADTNNGHPVTKGRAYALDKAPAVLRTFQHVFEFLDYVRRQRGLGGNGLKNMLGRLILGFNGSDLEYQTLKYRNRVGFTPRDLLRLAHLKPTTAHDDNFFGWVVKPESEKGRAATVVSARLRAFEELQTTTDVSRAAALIADQKMTHEFVPTNLLGERAVWEALLLNLPLTALIRNLRKMTQVGLLVDGNKVALEFVRSRLVNEVALKKARVHPLRIMGAIAAYSSGESRYGHGSAFIPSGGVLAILDEALELSWSTVEPLNKRVMVGIDKSGSMSSPSPMIGLSAFHACLALAAWYKRSEAECHIVLFDTSATLLNVSRGVRWSELKKIANPAGGTDTSAPLRWANSNKVDLDLVITLTDNDTWAGQTHYVEELARLRNRVSHSVANVIGAVTATESTVADPNDPHHLELVGFDPTVPEAIAAHVKEVFGS